MIIYLAGPIRPKGKRTLEDNVATAKNIALRLWKAGYAVISPHANSDLPITLADKVVEAGKWLKGDLEIMSRCDAVVVLPDWEQSEGTRGEVVFAQERNIPVFFYPDLPNLDTPDDLMIGRQGVQIYRKRNGKGIRLFETSTDKAVVEQILGNSLKLPKENRENVIRKI